VGGAASPAGSALARRVAEALAEGGYRVVPQWKVGKYRIALVVLGAKSRLAIECDGDRYLPLERIPEAMARQAVLERLGWKFERIRGSEFLVDPERALAPVLRRLETLGIVPGRPRKGQHPPGRILVGAITHLAQ